MAREVEKKEPRASRSWAGSESMKQGQDIETVSGCQRQQVREGSEVGEEEGRGLRWGWDRPAASIPEEAWKAGGRRQWSLKPVLSSYPGGYSAGHSVLAQGCPHCPSVAFTLLPIHIYLFIDFYEVSFPSNPYCSCCPDYPLAIQLSVQLSVCHKENKNNKQQDLCVVYGERWLGVQGAGTEAFQPSVGE